MTKLDLNCRLTQNPDLITADMDGEKVMMSIASGKYYGINEVGSRIWELLESPASAEEVCRNITGEFEVDEAQCRSDLMQFLGELLANDIVRIA